jgi:hypothetical protein
VASAKQSLVTVRRPLAANSDINLVFKRRAVQSCGANRRNVRSDSVMNFTAMFLAISVVMQLFLISADRHDDLYTASIESTELWYNPWPAPGDQTHVADGPCGIPSRVCVPMDNRQTSASDGVRAAF